MNIRLATPNDLNLLCDLDPPRQPHRRPYLQRAIAAGNCYLAEDNQRILGFLNLEHTFFGNPFIALLYIHSAHRRQGIGKCLIQHIEHLRPGPKLFTSTNLSNYPMQALLAHLGYKLTGTIHDLDEGDPELIYMKYLLP